MKKTEQDKEAVESRNRELALLAAGAMDEQRGEDILILDMRDLVDYADFFVICSASSLTRMRGVSRWVEKTLLQQGAKRLNQPDREASWILVDFGDILVHIFDNQAREFYRLEDLWGDAPRVDWAPLPATGTGNAGKQT